MKKTNNVPYTKEQLEELLENAPLIAAAPSLAQECLRLMEKVEELETHNHGYADERERYLCFVCNQPLPNL